MPRGRKAGSVTETLEQQIGKAQNHRKLTGK